MFVNIFIILLISFVLPLLPKNGHKILFIILFKWDQYLQSTPCSNVPKTGNFIWLTRYTVLKQITITLLCSLAEVQSLWDEEVRSTYLEQDRFLNCNYYGTFLEFFPSQTWDTLPCEEGYDPAIYFCMYELARGSVQLSPDMRWSWQNPQPPTSRGGFAS